LAAVLRGDVFWADLNPVRGREQAGLRPVLILSHDDYNARSGTAIAMAITSQPQKSGYPLTLKFGEGKMPKESWIKISQIRTISVERLGRRTCRIDENEMSQAIEGLLELIS